MIADVAMTKKGFGEMAMTGTMAGPIFNVLIGLGLSMGYTFIISDKSHKLFHFSYQKERVALFVKGTHDIDNDAVLPFVLIVGQLIVLGILFIHLVNDNF